MKNVNEQINRMKAMMTYGLQTEDKNKKQYSCVEYQRVGADGKMYGVVREGTKFYIKVSDKTTNVLKEDFNYVGGFMNRKSNEFTSYANALKNFEMKMTSLNEACGNKEPIIESWNPDKKEFLTLEATDKMKREIMRQRQIMSNAALINEKKNYEVDLLEACDCVGKECSASQKNNIKKEKAKTGEPTNNGGDPFTEPVGKEQKDSQKTNVKKEFKPVTEGEQTLSWNDNEDYLDTSNGTQIGDGKPFEEPLNSENDAEEGTVVEGAVMHNSDNQNTPTVGVGEIGDDNPFTERAKNGLQESEEDFMDDEEEGEETLYDDGDEEIDDFSSEEEFEEEPMDDEGIGADFEGEDDGIEARLSKIEELINKIASKLDVDDFSDDELYDEEGEGEESSDEFGEEEPEGEFGGEEEDMEDDEDEYEVFESVNFKKAVKEDKLDYFGKHPAYAKKPMKLPSKDHQEKEGYYDMNDESAKGEKPFGIDKGDSNPFTISPEAIENAIQESIKKIFKKKI